MSQFPAAALYETLYCARGEMGNRVKEQQMGLFADRTSTGTMRGHQLRLYFSSIAYIPMDDLRRLALKRYRTGPGAVHDDSIEALEDRRPDPHDNPPCLDSNGRRLYLGGHIPASTRQSATHLGMTTAFDPK